MKNVGSIILTAALLIYRSDATPLAKKFTSSVIEFPLHENSLGIRLERRANLDTLSQVLRGDVSINQFAEFSIED